MNVTQAEAVIIESCIQSINEHDRLLGIISGMKGNAKFEQAKAIIKAQRKHFIMIKSIFES